MPKTISELIDLAEASAARVEQDPMDAYAADEAACGLTLLCVAVRQLHARCLKQEGTAE